MRASLSIEQEDTETHQLSTFDCPECGNTFEIDPPVTLDSSTQLDVDCACGAETRLGFGDLSPAQSFTFRISD